MFTCTEVLKSAHTINKKQKPWAKKEKHGSHSVFGQNCRNICSGKQHAFQTNQLVEGKLFSSLTHKSLHRIAGTVSRQPCSTSTARVADRTRTDHRKIPRSARIMWPGSIYAKTKTGFRPSAIWFGRLAMVLSACYLRGMSPCWKLAGQWNQINSAHSAVWKNISYVQ